MIMIKATNDSESGEIPSEQLLTEMGRFNEELVKAGVLLAGERLQPSSKGSRVKFSGDKRRTSRLSSPRSWESKKTGYGRRQRTTSRRESC